MDLNIPAKDIVVPPPPIGDEEKMDMINLMPEMVEVENSGDSAKMEKIFRVLARSSKDLKPNGEIMIRGRSSFVTVTTEASVAADIVAGLGGKDSTHGILEKFTTVFAETYMNELIPYITGIISERTEQNAQDGVDNETKANGESSETPAEMENHDITMDPEADCIPEEAVSASAKDQFVGEPTTETETTKELTEESRTQDLKEDDPIDQELVEDTPEAKPTTGPDSENKLDGDFFDRMSRRDKEEKKKVVPVEDMKVELHRIDDIFDESNDERMFVAYDPERRPTSQDEELTPDNRGKSVLTLRRVFEQDNRTLKKIELDIKSPLILDVVKETVLSERARLETKFSLAWPNENLFRYRERLREAARKKDDLTARHIDVLVKLIEDEFASRIRDINDMFPKGTTNFRILREVFWPGDIVVDSNTKTLRAYRVLDASYSSYQEYLSVRVEYIDCDGEKIGSVGQYISVKKFEGIEYLNKLELFPLKYHSHADEVTEMLLTRGRKFVSLKGQQHKVYKGLATGIEKRGKIIIDSRVMIDSATFNGVVPDSAISVEEEIAKIGSNMENFMICSNRIPVFSFKDKGFFMGAIENITDIAFREQVFSQLVLPHPTKELIRVLVDAHSQGSNFGDFIEGKGKGLVILLHGPPGVGKTMTVETVSEYTRRPMYVISSGELGTTSKEVEKKLERILHLAKTFRAVLLLDEADVFLEQRSSHDLERNALVSVFLRLLEYYQGILFLTSNRTEQFDDAFHSRIHIAIRFSNIGPAARRQIWQNFGAHIDGGLDLSSGDYEELAKWDLNGRQIKNALNCCRALSAGKSERISMNHIKPVLEIVSGFNQENIYVTE